MSSIFITQLFENLERCKTLSVSLWLPDVGQSEGLLLIYLFIIIIVIIILNLIKITKIQLVAARFKEFFPLDSCCEITVVSIQGGSLTGGMFPTLIKLNESNSTLWNDLKALDGISVRTYDTAHVYCVKAGQSKLEDMLANVVSGRQCTFACSRLAFFLFVSSWSTGNLYSRVKNRLNPFVHRYSSKIFSDRFQNRRLARTLGSSCYP